MVRVRITRHSIGKQRLVRMMNSAGMLTTNWMSSGLASAKWALMAFKAGATVAPAITVSSDIERMVATRIFGLDESLFIHKNLFN